MRFDPFIAAYIALSLMLAIQQSIFGARFTRSGEIRKVFYAMHIDPAFARWSACLGLAEIIAIVDAVRWHLVPALNFLPLKAAGAAIYGITVAWLFYVDRYLYRNFAEAFSRGELLTGGPYRLVRHPRYTGLLFTRLAFPLMLASAIAWGLCAIWVAIVLRRTYIEEGWLRARFGTKYDRYAAGTPRLIPMIGRLVRSGARLGLIAGVLATAAGGVELKKETLAAFDRYVRQAEARIELQMGRNEGFLFATTPERRASLRAGAVLAEPHMQRHGLKVPSGLIHDWVGAVFIPRVSLRNVLELVQAYDRHAEFYRPEVVRSRVISHEAADYRIGLRLLKKKLLTVVLDTEHAVHYEQRGETRWSSRSRSTRIVEVHNPGTATERVLPADTGRGFLWRLNSYWTFQELDGGTYVECEAISLSRDVPPGLSLVINPIVRDLPGESLANTLRNTRAAAIRMEGN